MTLQTIGRTAACRERLSSMLDVFETRRVLRGVRWRGQRGRTVRLADRLVLELARANEPDRNAFKRKLSAAGAHEDVVVIRILGNKFDTVGEALPAFHRNVVAETCDD